MATCESCNKADPKFRCSACKLTLYCDKTCSRNHWQLGHKTECQRWVQHVKDADQRDRRIEHTATKLLSLSSDQDLCSVCWDILTEENATPLPCSHFVCVTCVFDLPGIQEVDSDTGIVLSQEPKKCPLCRQPVPDFFQHVYATAAEYVQLANKKPFGSIERTNLCNMARKQIARVESFFHFPTENESPFLLINRRTMDTLGICLCEGKPTEAIQKANDLLTMELEQTIQIDLHTKIGESYILLEDFEQAKGAFANAFGICDQSMSKEVREILHCLCQCFYELKMYDRSIELGESAISMNRHYQGVYKYVALSYKASGNLDKAIEVMNMAAAYETPWDESNKLTVKKMLQDLLEEKRNTTTETD